MLLFPRTPAGRLVFAGLLCVAGGLLLAFWTPSAEATIHVRVHAAQGGATRPERIAGASRVADTLVALATLDGFIDHVSRSGFAGLSTLQNLLPSDRRLWWERHVSVERIRDSLAVRVRARGRTTSDARSLVSAVVHGLVLEGPTAVGDHGIELVLEIAPSNALATWRDRLAPYVIMLGTALFLFGKPRLPSMVFPQPPSSESLRSEKATPEEGKRWLQQFLEEHERGVRSSPR